MKIAIGSDHAGFQLKESLRDWLVAEGHDVIDVGTYTPERTDYPRFGSRVGRAVASGEAELGVACCGSGQGISMSVNKVPGARGAVIHYPLEAEMTRRHNNANVACFGERFTTEFVAQRSLEVFLATPFDGGRHTHRVDQLTLLDETHGKADI
jgi:ribose 5-phosphate isomerase B